MYVVEMKLSICKKGEVLADHVADKNGAVIVGKNTVLNDYIISKLKGLDIKSILVYKNIYKENWEYHHISDEKSDCKAPATEIKSMIHN